MHNVETVKRHHSLLLMNSFNKTEAAVFSCRLCFLMAFPFISLSLITTNMLRYVCGQKVTHQTAVPEVPGSIPRFQYPNVSVYVLLFCGFFRIWWKIIICCHSFCSAIIFSTFNILQWEIFWRRNHLRQWLSNKRTLLPTGILSNITTLR